MRVVLLIAAILAFADSAARGAERFVGLLTFGCGDRYINLKDVAETWLVNLSVVQDREMLRLTGNAEFFQYAKWMTLHVELMANVHPERVSGFFGEHAKRLDVERVISARFTEPGESVEAATRPAQVHRGYLLLGPESVGFVPLTQSDEFWWVVPGKASWDAILERFRPIPDLGNKLFYNALVEIMGRVGPPGAYGHGNDFIREIAVDDFTYLNAVEAAALVGTAGIFDVDDPESSTPKISKCVRYNR